MSTGIFISYNHKDGGIASALVEALTSLSSGFDVFIDHSGIEGGDDYEVKISESIGKAQWFIMICSGPLQTDKDMSWCFYEAGQFRVKLQATDQSNKIRDRICFIYDKHRPSQLGRYQGYFVTNEDRNGTKLSFRNTNDDSLSYESTDLFKLFEAILQRSVAEPLRDLKDPNVRKLMRTGVRNLMLAFADNQPQGPIAEEVFQPRISFMVSPAEVEGVKPGTTVAGEFNALPNIFSIAGTTTTWDDIRRKVIGLDGRGVAPMWLTDLEKAIMEVADGGVPHQTDFLCLGKDGRFYRPIVARNEVYGNGYKKCFIAFIPSRDRRFNLSYRTSLILTALILSIRFRQRVLPLIEELKNKMPDKKKSEVLQKLVTEIVLVESESMEFGLKPPKDEHDEPQLLTCFREGQAKEFMRTEIVEWGKARSRVFDIIKEAQTPDEETSWSDAANVVSQTLANLREINGTFVEKLCQELLNAEKIQ